MDIDTTPEELRLAIAKVQCWAGVRYDPIRREWVGEPPCEPDVVILNASVPDWPNDIAAAWELVGEIPHGVTVYQSSSKTSPFTRVVIHIGDDEISAAAQTAPIAISRAYLKWKEG